MDDHDAKSLANLAEIRLKLGLRRAASGWHGHRAAPAAHWIGADGRAACGQYVDLAFADFLGEAPPAYACSSCLEWLELRATPLPPISAGRRAEIAAELAALGVAHGGR